MIQQIGSVQQNIQIFSKKAIQSANEDFSKLLTPSIEKIETNEINEADEEIYSDLATKYDVRNATFEEFSEIANALYEAGEITFLQSSLMRFDYDRATRELKSELGNKAAPDFSLYETRSDSTGRRDWISEWEARLSKDMKYDVMGFHHTKGILTALKRLENN